MSKNEEKWATKIPRKDNIYPADNDQEKEIKELQEELEALKEWREQNEADAKLSTKKTAIYCAAVIVTCLVIAGLVIVLANQNKSKYVR